MYYTLPINLELLTQVLRDETPGLVHFIDLDTGGIFSVIAPKGGDLDVCECHPLKEFPERFVTVYELPQSQKTRLVTEFAGGVADAFLARRLKAALRSRSPLGAVEEVLAVHPGEMSRWRSFLREALLEEALAQLAENDIGTTIPVHVALKSSLGRHNSKGCASNGRDTAGE